MGSDLNQLRELYRTAVQAFIQGDPDVMKPLWSARGDVTLANPLGPPVRGWDRVRQHFNSASAQIRDGEDYAFDSVSFVETADIAYEVGIERSTAKLGGAAEKVPVSLRVTTIFRREGEEWKIVHRHADPITEERPVQSVVRSSGHLA